MILPLTILKQDLAAKLYPQSSNVTSAMQLLRKEIKVSNELTHIAAKLAEILVL